MLYLTAIFFSLSYETRGYKVRGYQEEPYDSKCSRYMGFEHQHVGT